MVTNQERDIIINAIRVLRSRRVRPSARKIAWYVRREHLLSELTTEAVLDELVESEDVLRVEYKGATSYRVAASWAKADLVRRRPTRTKVNVMNSESTRRALRSAVEAYGIAGASKEQIEEKLAGNGHQRLIEKLDLLLHREIRAGTLLRVETTHRTASLITYVVPADAPAPPPSPPSPATEDAEDTDVADEIDELEEEDSPTDVMPMHFLEVKKSPNLKQQQQLPPQQPQQQQAQQQHHQQHHHHQQQQHHHQHQQNHHHQPQTDSVTIKQEFEQPMDEEPLRVSCGGTGGVGNVTGGPIKRGMGGVKRGRRGRPPLKNLGIHHPIICSSSRGRPPSRRNKRAKKVFDPSEGGLGGGPGRKKNATRCDVCFMNVNQHAIQEDLLVCHRCQARAHPSCLGYSEELAVKSRHGPWTCMDCKHCAVCQMDHTIGTLIFCDECDRAYHLTCHQPPIVKEKQPQGSWICFACAPQNTQNPYDCLPGLPTPRDSPVPDDESRGSSGSWDNNIYDPEIPNVTHWTVEQIMEHFNGKGFGSFTQVFRDQDIDGTALLMLTRADVLMGLNLKLGPALKIYKQIRILQTRLPNPPLP
ncbi:sterile alpha motif domain-containing protein 1-like isoform X1 [Palaemon carinicauda]|uniref:sterile alpha motif domain-containing protein 1-like isoform X1 n=1 Tax=Palaemon carinicauda TaxID=392227 RepID=UPI0035B59F27